MHPLTWVKNITPSLYCGGKGLKIAEEVGLMRSSVSVSRREWAGQVPAWLWPAAPPGPPAPVPSPPPPQYVLPPPPGSLS